MIAQRQLIAQRMLPSTVKKHDNVSSSSSPSEKELCAFAPLDNAPAGFEDNLGTLVDRGSATIMERFDSLPPIEVFPCASKALFASAPLDNAPARLGFEDNLDTSVDPGSVWGSIIRDPQLPVIAKKNLNMKKDVRDVFLAVVNGSFDGEYSLSVQGQPKTPEHVCYLGITVFCPRRSTGGDDIDAENEADKEVLGRVFFRAFPYPDGQGMHHTEATEFEFRDAKYGNVLTDDAKDLLKNRVLHYFIRQKASQLDYYLIRNLVTFLNLQYANSRSYQEILDSWLILGDVSIASCQVTEQIHQNLIRTAESLEGLRFYSDAAQIYEEAALKYSAGKSVEDRCKVYHFAGLAFKRADEFDDAERQLILGWNCLCEGSEKVTLVTEEFNSVFISLCGIYARRASAEHEERRAGVIEHRRMHQMVMALLYTAKFRAAQDGYVNESLLRALNNQGGPFARKMLPRSIRNKPVEALKLLVKAGSHSTVSGFRRALLLAQDRQNLRFVAQYSGAEMKRPVSGAKTMRRQMRDHYTGGGATLVNREMCQCCEAFAEANVTLMQCPCRAVRYCNPTCQKEHWAEHKQYCTWHKEKKKKAKSAKGKGAQK